MRYLPLLLLLASCSARHVQRSSTTVDSTVHTTTQVTTKDFNSQAATKTVTVKDSSGQSVTFAQPVTMGEDDDSMTLLPLDGNPPYKVLKTPLVLVPTDGDSVWIRGYGNNRITISKKDWEGIVKGVIRQYPPAKQNTVKFKDGKIVEASGNIESATASATHDTHTEDSLYTLVQIQHDSIATLQAEKHVGIRTVTKTTRSWWWLWLTVGIIIGWIARPYWPGLKLRIFGIQTKRNYMLLGIFGGGLWIIPLLTLIGFVIFLRLALKASHSGSTQQTPGGIVESDQNVSIWKTGWIWFAIACALATIAIVCLMISDK